MDQTVTNLNIGSLIRGGLMALAGIAVNNGIGTAELWQTVVGGIVGLGTIAWIWWKNRKQVATVKTALLTMPPGR